MNREAGGGEEWHTATVSSPQPARYMASHVQGADPAGTLSLTREGRIDTLPWWCRRPSGRYAVIRKDETPLVRSEKCPASCATGVPLPSSATADLLNTRQSESGCVAPQRETSEGSKRVAPPRPTGVVCSRRGPRRRLPFFRRLVRQPDTGEGTAGLPDNTGGAKRDLRWGGYRAPPRSTCLGGLITE